MNIIDIIIGIILLVAIFNGWREGVIVQIGSLMGVVIGLWVGSQFGAMMGEWLNISPEYRAIGGFLVMVVVVLILVAILSRLMRSLFKFVGFGLVDKLVGVALSLCKYVIILSALLSCMDYLNQNNTLISRKTIAESMLYRPIVDLSKHALPMLHWAEDQVDKFSHGI